MTQNKQISITEVGPRDGLQNEKQIVSLEDKKHFIDLLIKSGAKNIETASFVSPKWVPQMADTAEIYQQIACEYPDLNNIALVPNQKGLEKALEMGVNSIAVFTAASDAFNQKNINMTVEQSLDVIAQMLQGLDSAIQFKRGYISTVFECPYSGKVAVEQVLPIVEKLFELGVDEISLGDTIGVAVPTEVELLLKEIERNFSLDKIAMHFHDTRGTALANVLISLQMGVRSFDSSAGGLGGCPYAPGAAGNLATEDLVYCLERMAYSTGIDLLKLCEASKFMAQCLKTRLPSRFLRSQK